MAKATAARNGSESRRISVAILAATGAHARVPEADRPDLVTTAVLAVLDVALDALRSPAAIVDQRGIVICSNAAARALVGGSQEVVRWSPPPANRIGRTCAVWEVTPLAAAGRPDWSLVILRTPDAPSRRRWNLTTRQGEVLELVARGMTNTGIADALGIRLGTVEFHISAIFDKVGVSNRAALIATLMSG
jgi:DNA-binding CsgD family transcriptional regulator